MDPFYIQINSINDAIRGCIQSVDTIKKSYEKKIPQYSLKIDTTDVERVLNKLNIELDKLNQKVRAAGYLSKTGPSWVGLAYLVMMVVAMNAT